jgi:hypothetical protein
MLRIRFGDPCEDILLARHQRTVSFRGQAGQVGLGERKGDAKFATWDRDNFNYWNAQNRVLKSTLEVYSRVAIETKADAISATITFEADGTNVTTTVKDVAH